MLCPICQATIPNGSTFCNVCKNTFTVSNIELDPSMDAKLKVLEESAMRAFDSYEYGKCVQLCNLALDLKAESKTFKVLKHKASFKITEKEFQVGMGTSMNIDAPQNKSEQELEKMAQDAYSKEQYEKCITYCNQILSLNPSHPTVQGIKYNASIKILDREYRVPGSENKSGSGGSSAKFQEMREYENQALMAFENGNHEECIAICEKVQQDFGNNSPSINELKNRANDILKDIEERLTLCKFFMEKKNWAEVIDICNEILKISGTNKQVKAMLANAQAKIDHNRIGYKVFTFVLIPLISLSVILSTVYLSLKTYSSYKLKNEAQTIYNKEYHVAAEFYAQGLTAIPENSEKALELLRSAQKCLEPLLNSQIQNHLQQEVKQNLIKLSNDISYISQSINNAANAFENTKKEVQISLRNVDEKSPLLVRIENYQKCLTVLSTLDSEEILPYLESQKAKKLGEVKAKLEIELLEFINTPLNNLRAQLSPDKKFNNEIIDQLTLLLNQVDIARTEKNYLKAGELILKAQSLYQTSLSLSEQMEKLHQLRGPFIEKMNKLNISVLKKKNPELLGQIIDCRNQAEKAIESNDLKKARTFYELALGHIDKAIDIQGK